MSENVKKVSFARAAYAEAEKRLREAHADEFSAILDAIYAREGAKRSVRLTAEQRAERDAAEKAAKEAAKEAKRREKARATAEALLAEFPNLLDAPDAPVEDDSAA